MVTSPSPLPSTPAAGRQRHRLERLVVAQEHAQALLQLGGRLIERLDRLDAGAHLVALRLGGEEQQHRAAGLEQVAVLLQAFGEHDRLVMAGRIGQADDAHLVAGLGAPLGARHHGRGDASRRSRPPSPRARTRPTTGPAGP